ncbi:efflux RND transporter periplasmic adaptor subunit [Vibrio sp. 03-59-1]|uniref:efflux RND transporter periplasmic adaptor subunit n=1 Tax=Vibrio sp. 03-59-1 TaxID=2607607 RepID=UPI00149392C4|nr:efflux RND transporter periplasmic adaptor subunit [Vibrio sp. 03-59-1]NOH82932.1 efflux RND transporter periplasmic adaptor subunit [Vibrio sp. 03-59-1]
MLNFRAGGFFTQRPWLISFLLLLFLSIWLGLGALRAQEAPSNNKSQTIPLAKVVYQTFNAQATDKKIDLYGRTAPDRQATLGAEIAGKVTQVKIKKGDAVKKGQAIVQIDKGDLAIQLERANAVLRLKQKEFKAADSLKSRGLQGEVAYTSAQASLTEAKAAVSNAKLALSNTLIRAPFSGVVEALNIEVGDFVGVGDPVATLIDLDPLVIKADVSERHIQSLQAQQDARIKLLDGSTVAGKLRYISRMSSESTNTFPIEIAIANTDKKIPAGISAEVTLSLESQLAIKITPAMLALDDVGNLGVKTLQQDMVHFVPIQLVKAEQDGVWLTGLGEKVDIITIGQGFVRDGDSVIAIEFSEQQH